MNVVMGFIELGAIIFAWLIIWNFLVKGFTGAYPDSAPAQGLAAILN